MTQLQHALSQKLGPDGYDKIAIVGSAMSSTLLAPFREPGWAIWCTSPATFAAVANLRRADVWFELHRWLPYEPGEQGQPGTRPWFSPEMRQFLREFRGPVFMTETHPDIPRSVHFPYNELLEEFGPYHFASSVPLMLALAIMARPKTIGIFGVDMAATSEYAYQRPHCQHFVGLAKAAGIEIVLPPESDLMRHTTVYGLGEHNPRHIRISERIKELTAQKGQLEMAIAQNTASLQQVMGSLDAHQQFLSTWTDDIVADPALAVSFSGAFVRSVPAALPPKVLGTEASAPPANDPEVGAAGGVGEGA